MSPAAVTVNGQYRGLLSRFRGGGVASDNVAVLLAVRSVFWDAYSSIRRPRAHF